MTITFHRVAAYLFLLLFGCQQNNGVNEINYETFPITKHADSPPMGWNSWNNFGYDINEREFKDMVDYMSENLNVFGYEYAVIDLGWYGTEGSGLGKTYKKAKPEQVMDEYGRLLPATNKFPSCKDGSFKPIADYVHDKGLKFGIHIMRGIPWQAVEQNTPILGTDYHARDIVLWDKTCVFYDGMRSIDMSKPGAQEYYNSIASLYAEWGVDFIKADDMISYPPKYDEMKALRYAMEQDERPMVLSLSPGHINFWDRNMCTHYSEMYRVSGDVWDKWEHMERALGLAHQYNEYANPGGWADLDMLVLGYFGERHEFAEKGRKSRLTTDEQYTHFTLWAMANSPLMLGMHLGHMDDTTLSIISNKKAIAVNQEFIDNKQTSRKDGIVMWEAQSEDGTVRCVAIFNLNDHPVVHRFKTNFQFDHAYDIWNEESLTTAQTQNLDINAHGVRFIELETKN